MTEFIVIGAAHRDQRGQVTGDLVPGASNPGRLAGGFGGAAFNAARILAALGNRVTLISPRANDADATAIAGSIHAAGITDRPVPCPGMPSACYTAILDRNGGLVVALADMALYDSVAERAFLAVLEPVLTEAEDAGGQGPTLLMDANLPPACLARVAAMAAERGLPLHAIGTSPAKVPKLAAIADGIATIFLNASEAAALGAAGPLAIRKLREVGFRTAIVTNGPGAVTAYDERGAFAIAPPPLETVADVTGAGDALTAATLSAMAAGEPLAGAVRSGIAASRLVLTVPGAVNEQLTAAAVALEKEQVPAARRIGETAGE